MAGTLYLVPTPLGNLNDLTPRAVQTLSTADFIAAEDTRVTLKLQNYLEIKKPMVSYHRHNLQSAGSVIVERILSGENCALVTDAGTPAISDPGEELVRSCAEAGIAVCALPGPCALITALSVSGLPSARFTFEGFLPTNPKNRSARLEQLRTEERTMVFYEAPHKLRTTLADFSACFGPTRKVAVCRELTKLHEEVLRLTLAEAAARYETEQPRGEFVLVIEGAAPAPPERISSEEGIRRVLEYYDAGLSMKAAVRRAAEETGLSKNELYAGAAAQKNTKSAQSAQRRKKD